MIRIGEDVVESGEIEFALKLPTGEIVQYDSQLALCQAAFLFGGQVMQRHIYICAWKLASRDCQPDWGLIRE